MGWLRVAAIAALAMLLVPAALATNVTFQVNMSFQQELGNFNPATDLVVTRGSFNGWAGNGNQLTHQSEGVYAGTWDIAPGQIQYKFVIVASGGDVWEADPNREATVGATPLVLPVDWFNRQPPQQTTNVEVLFRVDMTVQELTGNFAPDVDWVVIRGGHPNLGNWGGEIRLNEETGNPGVYSRWIQFSSVPVGVGVEYKFVILEGGSGGTAHWESSDNRSFVPSGNEPDVLPPGGNGFGEIMPALVYFANIGPDDIITNDLNVIFQVDVRPLHGRLRDLGFIYDVQTGDTVYSIESVQVAGFFNAWPWGNFSPDHILNDNGTNGDALAGDSVWSRSVFFESGSPRELIYKFGVNQLDVEADFAENHSVILNDDNPTFRVPTVCWGAQGNLYDDWQDECLYSAVEPDPAGLPRAYVLNQNYPNPFNPATTIAFALPRADVLQLKVYDVLGRLAATHDLGRLEAGTHAVRFDGSSLASGVYFYRLESPHFAATRKMLLLK